MSVTRWSTKPPLGTPLGATALHQGLVSFWPLNERNGYLSFDLGRMKNTGTHTATTWSASRARADVLFNGTTSKIVLSSSKFPAAYPFTYLVWARSTNAGSEAKTPFGLQSSSDSNSRVMFEWPYGAPGTNNVAWNIRNGGSEVEIAHDLAADDLYHCAVGVSRASNDHELFVDGVSRGTDTTNVTFPTVDTAGIGIRDTTFDFYFDGSVDMCAVWERALTAAEVRTLYIDRFVLFAPPLDARPALQPPAAVVVPYQTYYQGIVTQ